ncbi:hypothetical protein D3C86_1093840 [compost metagenome]
MTATALSMLSDAGVTARDSGDGRLLVAPVEALTDDLRRYIREHKNEILAELEAANAPSTNCQHCIHLRRPGKADGYCSAREDLLPAYGPSHPLRQCPADEGRTCASFVWAARWR